ncbi:MAG: hypothetical protein LBV13_02815 [Methanomassiliicoccaceae archaeon]|jgi:retron-type reverse transcriptase|nr:hypothetical protein [Methanomassiliicoccaceae archaeon]
MRSSDEDQNEKEGKASLLDELLKRERWEEFLDHKKTKSYLPKKVIDGFESFMICGGHKAISEEICNGTYIFSIPRKRQINKTKTGKKRDVYTYTNDETIMLKVISHLLHAHDDMFPPNLYSFRSAFGVKKAMNDLMRTKGLADMYGYKVDIKNYFNSVNVEKLLKELKDALADDERLYELIERILSDTHVTFRDEVIEEQKGIMAGVPISAFLANFYLKDMDWHFFNEDVMYMRYADDMIIFANTEEQIREHRGTILSFLGGNDLSVNPSKEFFYAPGEKFEFLGFSYMNGIIDLSDATVMKIKAKIRRASRTIRRWSARKKVTEDSSLRTMIKKFDRKFFGKEENELSWKYWFFPTINTDAGLKEVDAYMQDRLRYLVTGKNNKKNHEHVPYQRLKGCGYRSLVHEFHSGRK